MSAIESTINTQSFANLFPYRIYHESRSVFINKKSVMKIAEIPLLSGASGKLIADLVGIFNKNITEDITVRIFRLTHRKCDKRLTDIMSAYQQLGGIYSGISEKQIDYMRFAACSGFYNASGIKTALLDSQIFLELSVSSCAKTQDEKIDTINQVFEKVKTQLHTTNIPMLTIGSKPFLSLLKAFIHFDYDDLCFDHYYDENQYLSEAFSRIGQEIDVERDGLNFKYQDKESKATTYTFSRLPTDFSLYNTGEFLANIGKMSSVTCPHIFSISFKLIANDKAKARARSKYFSLEKQANSMMVKLFPKLRDQFNEWASVRDGLERDDIRMSEMYAAITLFSEAKNHHEYCSQFENTMKSCSHGGFELHAPCELQLPLFLSNFPGLITEGLWDDLKKASLVRKATTWNIINLLPILGDWKGSYTGFIAPGLRNQISAIDIFSNQIPTDNNNVAITGGSGAGKSVITQTMIFHVLSNNGVVFIIDKGESYKKLCQVLSGVYIDGKSLKLNPFTYLNQIKDQSDLKQYFSLIRDLLATIVSPNGDLDSVSRAYLLEAAFRAYEKHQENTNIDSVVEELKEIDQKRKKEQEESDRRLGDLIVLLQEYMTK